MSKTREFFDLAIAHINQIKEQQKDDISKVARMMGDCMAENGIVQLFGLEHGAAFSMELGYRAGGLMPFHQIRVPDLILRNAISEAEFNNPNFNDNPEIASKLLALYNIDPQDMFIFISYAGNEPLIVETALHACKHGHQTVAVVNRKLTDMAEPLHPSGKKLTDIVDFTLAINTPYPDTVLNLSNGTGFGQLSTICGNTMAQMLTAETYRYLKESGQDCPILLSANVKGADVHNRAISDKYLGRWNS